MKGNEDANPTVDADIRPGRRLLLDDEKLLRLSTLHYACHDTTCND